MKNWITAKVCTQVSRYLTVVSSTVVFQANHLAICEWNNCSIYPHNRREVRPVLPNGRKIVDVSVFLSATERRSDRSLSLR